MRLIVCEFSANVEKKKLENRKNSTRVLRSARRIECMVHTTWRWKGIRTKVFLGIANKSNACFKWMPSNLFPFRFYVSQIVGYLLLHWSCRSVVITLAATKIARKRSSECSRTCVIDDIVFSFSFFFSLLSFVELNKFIKHTENQLSKFICAPWIYSRFSWKIAQKPTPKFSKKNHKSSQM